MNGGAWSRDGRRPNRGGWHGSPRVLLFRVGEDGGEGALAWAWASTAAGTADGGLRQVRRRGREGDQCSPYLARWRKGKKRCVAGEWWSSPASLVRRNGCGIDGVW
ncbi:hypothetical protein DEO72_LG7g1587 [Vigna unguiculata]|uniref:Uncharacterized protein n=1 Tax=Vigna unguiculata TaxID=3917 RepID=A0A4D6MJX5_VIGUN|nr:hypothetical protein DEO72_LG7g1587 [Vigna unguiculata]